MKNWFNILKKGRQDPESSNLYIVCAPILDKPDLQMKILQDFSVIKLVSQYF